MICKIFDKYANYYDYRDSPVLYVYSKITNYGIYCKISRYVGINKNTYHMILYRQ